MPAKTVIVGSSIGLHARPATLFVQAVNATGRPVMVSRADQKPVDARSMLAVMAMGATHGETVTLTCAEEGSEEALDSLVELLGKELDPK